GGYNRFYNAATTSFAEGRNPSDPGTSSRGWTDVNSDNIVQYQMDHDANGLWSSTCVYKTLGCELDFASLSKTYGQTTFSDKLDPAILRGFQNKINLGISHELMKGVSVTFEWFRTDNKNPSQTYNLVRFLTTPDGISGTTCADANCALALINYNKTLDPHNNPNYHKVTAFSPLDGSAVELWEAATSTISSAASNNWTFTDTSDIDPTRYNTYNGFDIGFNARLPRGGRMFGGTTTEKTLTNSCGTAIVNPDNLRYCDGTQNNVPWRTQFKLSATYPLPWAGLIVNGSFSSLPGGIMGQTTYSVSKSTTYTTCPGDSVAHGCTVGAVVVPGQVSTTLSFPLDPPNTFFRPRINEVDLGLTKRIKIGRVRIDPKLDLFNLLNADTPLSTVSTTLSPILNPAA